jgi:hypothetical protein
VQLAEQWRRIEGSLPDDWAEARLLLRVPDSTKLDRAAALLAPLNAGRTADGLRFSCSRRGPGALPDLMARLLARLDREGIQGTLELVDRTTAEPEPVTVQAPRAQLADAWDAEVDGLPSDWSDVYAEVELTSTDFLERAALLIAPLNPARHDRSPVFRFRSARRSGYGASPEMARRCFERLDAEGITGEVRIVHSLADTHHVSTQGPVWYVGGRSV